MKCSDEKFYSVMHTVMQELEKAEEKHPDWPADPIHAMAIVQEEVGETQRAILHAYYEPHRGGRLDVVEEATQMAAMAIRFLLNESDMQYGEG